MGVLRATWNKQDLLRWATEKASGFRAQMNYFIYELLSTYMLIARVLAPYRTGELRDSITIEIGDLKGELIPAALHAVYVLFGTPPHEILPKLKQALYWEGAMHPVKIVEHPGTKPNDFLADTVQVGDPEADKMMENIFDWVKT